MSKWQNLETLEYNQHLRTLQYNHAVKWQEFYFTSQFTVDWEIFVVKRFSAITFQRQKLNLRNIFLTYEWSKFILSSGHSDQNKARWNFKRLNILLPKNPDLGYFLIAVGKAYRLKHKSGMVFHDLWSGFTNLYWSLMAPSRLLLSPRVFKGLNHPVILKTLATLAWTRDWKLQTGPCHITTYILLSTAKNTLVCLIQVYVKFVLDNQFAQFLPIGGDSNDK